MKTDRSLHEKRRIAPRKALKRPANTKRNALELSKALLVIIGDKTPKQTGVCTLYSMGKSKYVSGYGSCASR